MDRHPEHGRLVARRHDRRDARLLAWALTSDGRVGRAEQAEGGAWLVWVRP